MTVFMTFRPLTERLVSLFRSDGVLALFCYGNIMITIFNIIEKSSSSLTSFEMSTFSLVLIIIGLSV